MAAPADHSLALLSRRVQGELHDLRAPIEPGYIVQVPAESGRCSVERGLSELPAHGCSMVARATKLLKAPLLRGYAGQPSTGYALKLTPYVFVRPGELRFAEWREFDLDAAEWRIPAEKMKMDEYHLVPLSKQVVSIIRELQPFTGNGKYLFPSLRTKERPISDVTLNAVLRRLGFSSEEQTAHGFRTIADTFLNELGFPPDIIELQLARKERNKVRAAYNRAQRLDERRKMMQLWADHLDSLRAGTSAGTSAGTKATTG
jgi:hypothetical protein